eukprot:TRINITY_DN16477_c2_g1_i1.p1 TRINITY_DN16477_c2_g1~~TRINITY_DN16477_c2_g1_i1.p1  ORF type:complete len:278 (+),score=39.89 TRINITY_DN16477_c2_g1_i1:123-956(+)
MGLDEPAKKKAKTAPAATIVEDDSLGGLYDFLPPADPIKDQAAKDEAMRKTMTRPQLPPPNHTRVIFLDVDGVLLPSGAVEHIILDGVSLPARNVKESDFSMEAFGSLRSIVQKTGAVIVLSSEWRRGDNLRDSLSAVLKSQDIPVFKDWTPIFQPKPELQKVNPITAWCERRAREIGKWLKDHPEVTSYVALDDLNFEWADSVRAAGTPWMKIRSVHTNDRICLTEEGAIEAVNILLNPPPEPKVIKKSSFLRDVSPGRSGRLTTTEDSADRIRLG